MHGPCGPGRPDSKTDARRLVGSRARSENDCPAPRSRRGGASTTASRKKRKGLQNTTSMSVTRENAQAGNEGSSMHLCDWETHKRYLACLCHFQQYKALALLASLSQATKTFVSRKNRRQREIWCTGAAVTMRAGHSKTTRLTSTQRSSSAARAVRTPHVEHDRTPPARPGEIGQAAAYPPQSESIGKPKNSRAENLASPNRHGRSTPRPTGARRITRIPAQTCPTARPATRPGRAAARCGKCRAYETAHEGQAKGTVNRRAVCTERPLGRQAGGTAALPADVPSAEARKPPRRIVSQHLLAPIFPRRRAEYSRLQEPRRRRGPHKAA